MVTVTRDVRRAGFSLLELLVVMGILLLVAAIGTAAFLRVGTVNRLSATEHLINDMVRQARLTARTSGSPVILKFDTTVTNGVTTGGTVSGVSQTLLWSCGFEDADFPVGPAAQATEDDFRARIGHTGTGLRLSADAKTNQRWPAAIPTNPANVRDPGRTTLTRRKGSAVTEGFALSIAVRPPLLAAGSPAPAYVPLIMVVPGTKPMPVDANDSVCGLRLELWTRPVIPDNGNPSVTYPQRIRENGAGNNVFLPTPENISPSQPTHRFWGVTGWIRPEGATAPIFITNTEDSSVGGVIVSSQQGQTQVDGGGAWEDLTLLYDGQALTLLRNGLPIATRPPSEVGAKRLIGYGEVQHVVLGTATYSGAWLDAGQPALPFAIPEDVILDDASLVRLGNELPQALPSGIIPEVQNAAPASTGPTTAFQVVILPSGRSTITSASGSTLTSLAFKGIAEEQDLKVIVDINPTNGHVTASQVKAK